MSDNNISPRVIVTTSGSKSPNLQNLLQYTDNLEQAFLPPQDEDSLDSVDGAADRSLNLVMN